MASLPAAMLLGLGLSLGATILTAEPGRAQSPRSGTSSTARPSIAIPEFKNTVTGTWWWQGPVAEDLAHALANELQATGNLKVVERRNINQVLSEQELAELGIVRKADNAAQKGNMTGAQYIVLGTVTSYDSATDVESKGSGMSFLGFGGQKQMTTTKDYVAIDIRVVNSSTGEIVGAHTVEGRATSTMEQKQSGGSLLPAAGIVAAFTPGMSSAGYAATAAAATFNFNNNSTSATRTPVGKALRAALVNASAYVSCLLVPQNNCMAAFEAQTQERRSRTMGTLQLE
jgi:curli biogenesis system outer membrane secretion channel CsgG